MAALHVFILYSYTGTRNFFWFQRVRKNARKQKSLFYFINIENPSNDNIIRGGKKIKFTACPKPRRRSFQQAPKVFWWAELISQFFCCSNSSKNITCLSGKLKTEFTSLIAESTSPGLSDTTFFARWLYILLSLSFMKVLPTRLHVAS